MTDIQDDNKPSSFPLHAATGGQVLPTGDLTIHVRINDPDYDLSAAGSDFINENDARRQWTYKNLCTPRL